MQAALDPDSRFVERDGHSIHYRALGDPAAPPVLLVMGLALSSRAWDALPQLLARDFRVLAFDNRGTGLSGRAGWAYRMAALADDAAAVLEDAGAARAGVFGISMGGLIAQELALRHPARVGALALGATFASFRRGARPSAGALVDLLLLNTGRERATPARVARILVSAGYTAQNPRRAFEWLVADAAHSARPRAALAQIFAVLRHEAQARLATLAVPTLVLHGTDDRIIPVENGRRLAAVIPGARLVELRGAGHCFPLEREEETVAALAQHFAAALAPRQGQTAG